MRAALSKPRLFDDLDPGWVQLVKFHNGAVALAEYAGAVAELRMARFGARQRLADHGHPGCTG